MYTAVVIDKDDRNRLIAKLQSLSEWLPEWIDWGLYAYETHTGEPLPHHVTLNLGKLEDGPNNPDVLDKIVELTVDAFCWDHNLGVCAARVSKMVVKGIDFLFNPDVMLQSTNTQPHITMCLLFGKKPNESNKLDWKDAVLTTPFVVHGVVEEC